MMSTPLDAPPFLRRAGLAGAVPAPPAEGCPASDDQAGPVDELLGDGDVFGFIDPALSAGIAAALVIFLAGKKGALPPPPRLPRPFRRAQPDEDTPAEPPDRRDPPSLTPRTP